MLVAGDRGKRQLTAPPPVASLALIPDELIVDIFYRVPVKSLLRFKCVCKSWKTLISDPQFAKTHFQRSTTDTSFTHHRLLPQPCFLRDDVVSCSVESLFNNRSTIPESLGYPLCPKCDIVGYCNGLFCLVCDRESMNHKRARLWNPCTKLMSQESPSCDPNRTVFGFGYDESSDTYKVVSVFSGRFEKPSVNVFSFGRKIHWRQAQSFPAVALEWGKSGEFVSGTLNWLAKTTPNTGFVVDDRWNAFYVDKYYVIVSFDLKKETCRELLLPHDIDRNCCVATTLGVLRECLYVSQNCDYTHLVVWQMMEHGVKESWTKLFSISYGDLGMTVYAFLEPLCMSEKGDILINTNIAECKVVLYNPSDNRLQRHDIQSNKSWFRSKVYVESLVSPPCLCLVVAASTPIQLF